MLLELLKRDLRLHWDSLMIPILVLGVGLGAVVMSEEGTRLNGLILETSFLIPMLPIAIHQRESSKGTLGDLLTLPVSREQVVRLRYLEALLVCAGMLVLAHVGAWLALSAASGHPIPASVMGGDQVLGVGLMLLVWFAFPMPFFLRWGLKGLGSAYFLLVAFFTLLRLIVPGYGESIERFIDRELGHPLRLALGVATLFCLSYLLSRKAFEGRDF